MASNAAVVAIVDDDESVGRALVRLLKSAEVPSRAFRSARSFLEELEHMEVSCLVLDLQLPDMSGLDLQRHLRTAYRDVTIPVIIITAHDDPAARQRCLAAGAEEYLPKPLDGEQLIEAVQRLTSAGAS
jgi:FixJ family two-component response regulator